MKNLPKCRKRFLGKTNLDPIKSKLCGDFSIFPILPPSKRPTNKMCNVYFV